MQQEIIADPTARPNGDYRPREGTLSGFVFARFREGFKPAMEAWLETGPLVNPDAPATPFSLDEYRLPAAERAGSMVDRAEDLASEARRANQRSDNYVLTAVVFALVLFFAAVAGRTRPGRAQRLMFVLTVVAMISAAVLLIVQPVTV